MNNNKYRWILYIISTVIVATIIIQLYWNYKNYQINKQQLINDVQQCLDDAVQDYYAELAESETLNLIIDTDDSAHVNHWSKDSLLLEFDFSTSHFRSGDSTKVIIGDGTSFFDVSDDTTFKSSRLKHKDSLPFRRFRHTINSFDIDSIAQNKMRSLTSMVMISLANDSLRLLEIDSLFAKQLRTKKIDLNYELRTFDYFAAPIFEKDTNEAFDTLMVTSESPFLRNNMQLNAYFSNPTQVILKRILSGILLSLLLVSGVIYCLFYLLRIINQQKQLSELKNDLISNITHEFKTPIATIGVAIESIKDFETMNDKERTKKYLDMSQSQLGKLNNMVEKLLETASLDSEDLQLNKDKIDLVDLLKQIIAKQEMLKGSKTIHFNTDLEEVELNLDIFHIENAITNIIDNAIKYGGDIIEVHLSRKKSSVQIAVADNGNTLSHSHKDKIFEKFYRVPKGNTHDIKGFGIGLFYTKTIIEKHQGSIELSLKNNKTFFLIELPNV